MTLADYFGPTPEERARLHASPFPPQTAEQWRTVAGMIHDQLLKAYAEGEIDAITALKMARSSALPCDLNDHIVLLANMARQLPQITQAGRRRPIFPAWLKKSAVTLIQFLREQHPNEPFAPNEANNYTTPITRRAMAQLAALGLCDPLTAGAEDHASAQAGEVDGHQPRRSPALNEHLLYKWYLEAERSRGLHEEATPAGHTNQSAEKPE